MQKRKIDTHISGEKIAEFAKLHYVNDKKPGFTRRKVGKHFKYFDLQGKVIKDVEEIRRINALAIPPAYTDVWISPNPNGHLQATGRDARGRKQYRYHPRWREVSDETKFMKMIAFAQALPKIRERINEDLSLPGNPKEKILATVVKLLEKTLIRVGNEEYSRENNSFGLTTLQNRHVEIEGSKVIFKFRGKSGKNHSIALNDRKLATIVKSCRDLPGHELFEYLDEQGKPVSISSSDVNAYLQQITNEHFTAKDFRTWAGTTHAVLALQGYEKVLTEQQGKKNIVEAIAQVANKLGNTPAICRKSYVHPEVFNAYLAGTLIKIVKPDKEDKNSQAGLSYAESSVLAFLKKL